MEFNALARWHLQAENIQVVNMDSKPVTKSKLNWTGFALVLLGAITDPSFQIFFGNLISPEWFSRLVFLAGWLVIAFRTLGTSQPITRNWKMPWGEGGK